MDTTQARTTSTPTLWRRCLRMPIGIQSVIAVGLGALIGSPPRPRVSR